MTQPAFFAAGRAIGLIECGRAADIALSDAPTIKLEQAIEILRTGKALANLPAIKVTADNAELLIFPWLCSTAAAQIAVERGDVKQDADLVAGASIGIARLLRAVANALGVAAEETLGAWGARRIRPDPIQAARPAARGQGRSRHRRAGAGGLTSTRRSPKQRSI